MSDIGDNAKFKFCQKVLIRFRDDGIMVAGRIASVSESGRMYMVECGNIQCGVHEVDIVSLDEVKAKVDEHGLDFVSHIYGVTTDRIQIWLR